MRKAIEISSSKFSDFMVSYEPGKGALISIAWDSDEGINIRCKTDEQIDKFIEYLSSLIEALKNIKRR